MRLLARELDVEAAVGKGRRQVLADDAGAEIAAVMDCTQEGQAVAVQEVVDHAGDEHRLAAAAQAGDGDAQMPVDGAVGERRQLVP